MWDDLLKCGRLARRTGGCVWDLPAPSWRPSIGPGLLGRLWRPGVAPTLVTLSEGVPPSESKGPPKYGMTVRTAAW